MKKTLMLLLALASLPASAETLLRCEGIDGNAFYVGEKSWVKDGGKSIKLNLVKNGKEGIDRSSKYKQENSEGVFVMFERKCAAKDALSLFPE